MGGASHNTEHLEKLAGELGDFDSEKLITDSLADQAIVAELWPSVGRMAGTGATYDKLYYGAHEATKSLDKLAAALDEALSSVADHYRRQEEQTASEVDDVDDTD